MQLKFSKQVMKTKKKKFDAVKTMRDIRDKMGERYYQNIDLLFKDLEKVRKKYGIKTKHKEAV